MHRPLPRTMRAALVAHVVGMLGATDHIKNIFRPSARNHGRGGAVYPRASERERLRNRIDGFSRLHDHHIENKVRKCPICDLGMTPVELAHSLGL